MTTPVEVINELGIFTQGRISCHQILQSIVGKYEFNRFNLKEKMIQDLLTVTKKSILVTKSTVPNSRLYVIFLDVPNSPNVRTVIQVVRSKGSLTGTWNILGKIEREEARELWTTLVTDYKFETRKIWKTGPTDKKTLDLDPTTHRVKEPIEEILDKETLINEAINELNVFKEAPPYRKFQTLIKITFWGIIIYGIYSLWKLM
jgi:hypothetical protein